ncbi:Outer envelope protein 64, mitochondrial [Sesamum angolense]|uniref:Outer envelope protein 64, mitochondrial n=1 Tax=Sesamum angolense TaxID=2727404 RepID=A0AAE2C114_9LAMI|nr:Outer envelope protein 64, mitochondrial [Sesamum angolense]
MSKLSKLSASNPRVWVIVGVGLAGILILAEVQRRRIKAKSSVKEDFGAFVERFELLPFPQPTPLAARLPLSGLTFAINDNIDVKGYVSGYGSKDWKRTHEAAEKTAIVVTTMLRYGATCVGKTVMDEIGLGENSSYGTPTNPQKPSHVPGGSSSGSAVAVAAQLVDFAIGTDTIGCVRVPASFCGILGFRPSHGIVSMIGVSPNSQSLDAVGCLAFDPSVLHRVGHSLLQLNPLEPKRTRCIIIADDLFQLSKVPMQKTVHVVSKVTEKLSGYQPPKHVNFGEFIASNVPSLKKFREESTSEQSGISNLKALSSVMLLLQRHEFKTNHEEWITCVKPKLGVITSTLNLSGETVDDGILVIPTVADPPKLNSKTSIPAQFYDRIYVFKHCEYVWRLSGNSFSKVAIPFGKLDDCPFSLSFIASHGNDKFLLDTVLDMYASLQEEVNTISSPSPLPYSNGDMDAAELLKEKGNASYKGKQWNKANVEAYLRRGTARESLLFYRESLQDFKHALVLEPQNKAASLTEKRLRKLIS